MLGAKSEEKTQQTSQGQVVAMSWEAPFPPPAVLKQFDGVIENGAERIFAEFEKEAEHRRIREKTLDQAKIWDQIRGQFYAFVIVLVAFFISAIAIYQGHPVVAAIFGAGGIGSIVFAFLREKIDSSTKTKRD